jgi:hypothetical protein
MKQSKDRNHLVYRRMRAVKKVKGQAFSCVADAPLVGSLATSLGSPVLPSSLSIFRLERCTRRRRLGALIGLQQLTRWHTVKLLTGGVESVLLLADNGLGFSDATSSCSKVSLDPDWLHNLVYCLLYSFVVEAYNHTRKVVGAEASESVIDERFGSDLRVLYVSDEVDSLLIRADVPEL